MTTCDTLIKEDVLTIYKTLARRYQKLNVSTKTDKTFINLPDTFIKSSLIAMFEDTRMVPYDIQSSQLIMKMPSGLVLVEDKDGMAHEGLLDSLNGNEAIIRENESDTPIHISNYKTIQFQKRFTSKRVNLSYLLSGLSWSAQHTLLIDSEESRAVVFKTSAIIRNDTGVIFKLTDLQLGIGDPKMSSSTTLYENEASEVLRPVAMSQRKVMLSASAAPSAAPSAPNIYETNDISNAEGMEDFGTVSTGEQTLEKNARLDILSLADVPIHKLYYYEIQHRNSTVEMGYRMIVPDDVHITSGNILIYNFNTHEKKLGNFLGSTKIGEQFQKDEVNIILGPSSLVRAECTISSMERTEDDDTYEAHGALEAHSLYQEKLLEKNRIEIDTKLPRIEEINIVCNFTNNSNKDVAHIVATYPLPTIGKIVEISNKPFRVKNGKMEYNIRLQPSSKVVFKCTIIVEKPYTRLNNF